MGSCFNLVKNAFATRRLALLVTSIEFWVILARAWAEIKILRIFDFPVFSFAFRFSPFFLFAAVIDLHWACLRLKSL